MVNLAPYLLKANPFKAGAVSMAVAVFGVLLGFVLFPSLIKHMLRKVNALRGFVVLMKLFLQNIVLKPGTDIRAMWTRAPFAVDFLVYIFNVTNPDAVIAGEKPIVQEIGPYYFE